MYVNKQEFNASSWRSDQGYTKMHGQPTIKVYRLIKNIFEMLKEQSKRDQILRQLLSQHIIKILPVQYSYKQYN
jgi:hypothetical protein